MNLYEKTKREKKEEIDKITKEQKETIDSLNAELQDKLQSLQSRYNSILKNAKEYGDAFLTNIEKEELEHEKEIEKISKELSAEIATEKEMTQRLQEENKELTKKNEKSKATDVEKQKTFEDLVIKNTNLLEEKVRTCISLLKMQEQLLEREQVVFSKDETIKNAKDEEINLENFRFMLDQKIKSLTSGILVFFKKFYRETTSDKGDWLAREDSERHVQWADQAESCQ